MKDKALVLMPIFMNYDRAIKDALESKYEVTVINNEANLSEICSYLRKNFFCRLTRKLKSALYDECIIYAQNKFENIIKCNIENQKNQWSVIICINGQYLSRNTISEIKRNNPNARLLLYLWDDMSNLVHRPYFDLFDRKYSFNLDDCNEYGLQYLPMFVAGERLGHQKEDTYDICIIGTGHPDRVKFVDDLYEKYKDKYSFYIYIYSKSINREGFYDKPLEYSEYIKVLSKSKCVMDIPASKQTGPTTRFFDALLTNTKVITVNDNIRKYPVFSENIYIIDRNCPVLDDEFINKTYVKTNYKFLGVKEWVEDLVGEEI